MYNKKIALPAEQLRCKWQLFHMPIKTCEFIMSSKWGKYLPAAIINIYNATTHNSFCLVKIRDINDNSNLLEIFQ